MCTTSTSVVLLMYCLVLDFFKLLFLLFVFVFLSFVQLELTSLQLVTVASVCMSGKSRMMRSL